MHILQDVAVMPCNMGLTKDAAEVMIKLLDAFGVQPECLALPKQPGQSPSKLCSKESLIALIEVLLDYSRGNLTDQLKREYGQVRDPVDHMQPAWHLACDSSIGDA